MLWQERLTTVRIEIPDQKKLVFEMTIPIRWGDMDAMGHVNNTTERARGSIHCG